MSLLRLGELSMNRFTSMMKFIVTAGFAVVFCAATFGQTVVTGDITGTVVDQSGAVVSGATVNLVSIDSGSKQTTTTSNFGGYRFALLKPGEYTVNVSEKGFRSVSVKVPVAIGQITTANVRLEVGASSEVLEVSGQAPILQTENGNI